MNRLQLDMVNESLALAAKLEAGEFSYSIWSNCEI